jgi:3-hydroxybutyryl-CoA dehydrogenase
MQTHFKTVGVVGAGAMGRGIAQIAAQAGSTVRLYDTQAEAVARGRDDIVGQWAKLQDKGRMDAFACHRHALSGRDPMSPPVPAS